MIEYLDKVIKPLVLILANMSGFVKNYKVKDGDKDKNNKLMSFHIDDDNLLEKYKTIWVKIEHLYIHIYIYIYIYIRGGSRVRLVRRMTKSRFLKKLATFYEIWKYERRYSRFLQKNQNSSKIGLCYDHGKYFK